MSERVTIVVDGTEVSARAGSSVAAALMSAGLAAARTSVTGEERAPLCGMGICYECRLTIDGVAHRRGCMVTVANGMKVDRHA